MVQQDPERGVGRRRTIAKFVAVALVVVAVIVVANTVDLPDPESIRTLVSGAGWWGIAGFVVVYAVLSSTPFPASTLTIAAGLLFGLAAGATVVVAAATIGAYLAYWMARALGRGPVARVEWGKLHQLDDMLGRRGLMSVLIVRLIPLFPFSLVNYTAGVSAVKQRDYLVGTMIGIVPGTVGFTALGAYGTSPLSWPFAAALAVVLAVGVGSWLLATRYGLTTRTPATRPEPEPDPDSECDAGVVRPR